jgi:glycosyltransferase involved in cell wall biosynthesis
MNILVTSIVDLNRVTYNRIHLFLNHLCQRHQITAFCLNAWWLDRPDSGSDGTAARDPYFQSVFDRVQIVHLTEGQFSPLVQEVISIGTARHLVDRVVSDGIDLHLNYASLVSGLIVARMMRARGIPTVLDLSDDLPAAFRASPQVPGYLRSLVGYAAEVLLGANVGLATKVTFITKALQSKYALPVDKSTLLPNGFDPQLFRAYPAGPMRRSVGIDPHDFVLGFVGILGQEWVDFAPVFGAVKGLIGQIPSIKMLIVGNGEGARRNQKLAAEYGIVDRTLFTGYVPHAQVPRYISCMDVCIVSFTDKVVANHASPIKLFEYMACQRPVISRPLAGVIEAVGDRVLYAASETEWTARILQLHEDPASRARMGVEGQAFVENNHSWDKTCQQFEGVLLEAASLSKRLLHEGGQFAHLSG